MVIVTAKGIVFRSYHRWPCDTSCKAKIHHTFYIASITSLIAFNNMLYSENTIFVTENRF